MRVRTGHHSGSYVSLDLVDTAVPSLGMRSGSSRDSRPCSPPTKPTGDTPQHYDGFFRDLTDEREFMRKCGCAACVARLAEMLSDAEQEARPVERQ